MSLKPRILLIEDDEDMIEAMKLTLEAQNYNVMSASNPDAGYKKAQKEKPDVIILDVMFGEKEETKGFDFAVKFKRDKNTASIPILMITAVNIRYPGFRFSHETDGEYLPVDDFINKPANPDELVEKVKNLLALKVSKWVNWPDVKKSE